MPAIVPMNVESIMTHSSRSKTNSRITSIHHLPREFLQAATIEEAASARHADPYDGPVDAYLNRGLHD
jgi:hypothetical protein